MQRNVDGQTRSASRVLPRQKRRDDAPSSFPPADRLVAACSFPVLPSLALNLKGANAAAASTHVQVPQTLATRPQTLSHYDQLNQLQEAMREKLRSETAALREQLALALARAECAEAQLKDLLDSRRRPTVPPVPPVPKAAVAEEAVAEAAALRGEVERLKAEAVTLRRTMQYERQQARGANSAWHGAERGAWSGFTWCMSIWRLSRARARARARSRARARARALARSLPRRVLFLAWLLERGANLLDAPVEAPQLQKRLAGALVRVWFRAH